MPSPLPQPSAQGFADPVALIARTLDVLRPPARVRVSECATQHRRLANAGGGHVGRWSSAIVPYLVAPMDALQSRAHQIVAVVGPGQSAKTSIAENWLLHSVLYDQANMLWYMQTDEAAEDYARTRLLPMVDLHEDLAACCLENSLWTKAFRGMRVSLFAANNSSLISKTAPRIVADEIDGWKAGLGDTVTKLKVRMQTFGSAAKLLALSHPDRSGVGSIMALYGDSDARVWMMPCPHCTEWAGFTPNAAARFTLHYQADAPLEDIRAHAILACPACGGTIAEPERLALVASGQWVGRGQQLGVDGRVTGALAHTGVAGFWIHGLMSPFVTLGELAHDEAKAIRLARDGHDERALREVRTKRFGEPYTRAELGLAQRTAAELQAPDRRAGYARGTVPAGVRFLTAAVDVQGDRFEVGVTGWGLDAECWWIDRFAIRQINAHTDVRPGEVLAHWRAALQPLVHRLYPLDADPAMGLPLACTAIDTGGVPGVTERARDFGAELLRAGLPAWSVLLIKGASDRRAEEISAPTYEKDERGRRLEGRLPLFVLGVDALKRKLDLRLRKQEPGPGFVHFFDAFDERHFDELAAEQLVDGKWQRTGANETWDLAVYTEAARLKLRADRAEIQWTNPPDWARARPMPDRDANAVRGVLHRGARRVRSAGL